MGKFPAKALVGLKVPLEVTISSDGRWIALTVQEPDWDGGEVVTHLWVGRVGQPLRQWTFGKEEVRSPRFSPDGKWLAFLKGEKGQGVEGEAKAQLWLMPLDGGEAKKVTDEEEGVVTFAWHPDGKALWFVAPQPKPRERKSAEESDKGQKRDYVIHDAPLPDRAIRKFSVPDGKNETVFVGDGGIKEVTVSRDGTKLIFMTTGTGKPDDYRRATLFGLDILQRHPRRLCHRPGAQFSPRFSPDGQEIAFLSQKQPERSFSHLRLFATDWFGKWREIVTLPDLEPDATTLHWTQNGFLLVLMTGVTSRLWRLTPEAGEPLDDGTMVTTALAASFDGKTVAAIRTDDQTPPDVWIGMVEGTKVHWERVSDFNPQGRKWRLPGATLIRWGNEGLSLEGLLWRPPEETSSNPLLVWVHGGPKGRATKALLDAGGIPAFLAANGYFVFAPNFRGSAGYSNDFALADFGDLGGGDFRDIMAGVDQCLRKGYGDPERLGILGGSYGGYMTNWALTQTDRFKAGVSLYGITSFFSDFGNSEIPSWELDYLGGFPWDIPQLYLERSPMTHAHQITAPLLLLHGESDRVTFISNSQELYTALKKLGRIVQFIRYPHEGHGFRGPYHRTDVLERLLRWFDRWLKGDPFAGATPFGETAEGEGVAVTVMDFLRGATFLNLSEGEGEKLVSVTVRFRACRGDKELVLSRDVRLQDEEGKEYPAVGVASPFEGRNFVVAGEVRITLPYRVEFPLTFVFRVPSVPNHYSLRVWDEVFRLSE